MRLFLSINGMRIPIKNIYYKPRPGNRAILCFKCSRKYEDEFYDFCTYKFIDRHRKTIFQADDVYINMIQDKILYVCAEGLRLDPYGYIGRHYLSKILSKTCNSSYYKRHIPKEKPISLTPGHIEYQKQLRRLQIRRKAFYIKTSRWCLWYKMYVRS